MALFLLIHLIIPILGILYFFKIKSKIEYEKIADPPIGELFVIYVTYGGLILAILTSLFWKWSAMASLGMAYLTFIAPIIMGIISYSLRYKRKISLYHNLIYLSGILYIVALLLLIVISFLIER